MARKPSKQEMEQYDLERHIKRRVELMHMCELELHVLRKDPVGSQKAKEELKRNHVLYSGNAPRDPQQRALFLENCEKIILRPATNHQE